MSRWSIWGVRNLGTNREHALQLSQRSQSCFFMLRFVKMVEKSRHKVAMWCMIYLRSFCTRPGTILKIVFQLLLYLLPPDNVQNILRSSMEGMIMSLFRGAYHESWPSNTPNTTTLAQSLLFIPARLVTWRNYLSIVGIIPTIIPTASLVLR